MKERSNTVLLRDVQQNDLPLYYAMYASPEVMRYTLIDATKSLEAYLPYFLQTLEDNKRSDRLIYEYVVLLQDGQSIGMCNIKRIQADPGNAEIGYMLLPPYWGKGYGTNVAQLLIRMGFTELGLKKVTACCNANNIASEAVMKKCGMHREALLKAVRYKDGEWQDELRYAITYTDWSEKTYGSTV